MTIHLAQIYVLEPWGASGNGSCDLKSGEERGLSMISMATATEKGKR
jgi:hypothetical protein